MARHFVLLVLFSSAFFQLFGQPVAQFQASITEGCVPLVVNFEDQSTGAVAWEWDLGISTSNLPEPSGLYASAGTFSIRLIVTDATGLKDTLIRTDYIETYALPVADFSQDQTEICTHESIQFTDLSQAGSGSITQWQWDFGDGNQSAEASPLHQYTSQGTFPVSLAVTNQYGCSHTITQQGLILTKAPDPAFEGDELIACGAPLEVQFTSTGTTTGTHTWDFGDGSSSNSLHPTHTYQNNGSFSVQHVVVDADGCADTLNRIDYVNLGLNTLGAYAEDSSLCIGDSLKLHTNAASNSTVIWDMGNGDTLVGLHPVYFYPLDGNYQIQAFISDPSGCATTISIPVDIYPQPVADFAVADTTIGCEVPFTVQFVNLSTGGLFYEWILDSPNGSSDFEPSYTYTSVDSFGVTLTVTGPGGCTDKKHVGRYIKIRELEAGFTADLFAGCAPLGVSFSDTSFSPFPITQWQWSLGDGSTSNQGNPTHTYQDTGWYDVSLIVENDRGCRDTAAFEEYISAGELPTAAFSIDTNQACALTLVQFENLSSGATDYTWYFGDGDTAMSTHPQHGFVALGMMDVMLVASDRGCLDTAYLANAIEILAPLPIIGISDRKVCDIPGEVVIQDFSIGADTRTWTVNGFPTSSSPSFTHLLTSEGSHQVGLTVSNTSTGCVVTSYDFIEVLRAEADFVPDTNRSCVPFSVSFTNQSLNATKCWWEDGKGNKTSMWEPTFSYADTGSYFPSLVIENELKCRDTFGLEIKGLGVFADVNIQNPDGCAPYVAVFLDQSTGTGTLANWLWDFGDGGISTLQNPTHIFDSVGSFDVQLIVTDGDGCIDSTTRSDAILSTRPEPAFTVSPSVQCPSDELIFVSQSDGVGLSYLWDFGDGTTSTLANPIHSYAQSGFYDIELTVTDVNGCDSTLAYPQFVQIGELLANFSLDTTFAACPPLAVSFAADTNFPHHGISYHWDFGNGATSSETHPTHIYTLPGIYTVQLIVSSDGGCSDTLTMNQIIEIEGPTATFTFDPGEGCPGTLVSFAATANQPLDYTWLFGDGSTDQGEQIQHVYPDAGAFVPTLVIQDTLGCEVYHISPDTIDIYSPPNTQIGIDQAVWCESGNVQFSDQSTSGSLVVAWEWSFGDGGSSTDQHPQHTYTGVGNYDVQLITTDANGCSDTLMMPDLIQILPNPVLQIVAPDTAGCVSFDPELQASAPNHVPMMTHWNWAVESIGDSISGSSTIPTFSAAGTYQVVLTGWDEHGCIGRDTVDLIAWPLPNSAFVAHDSVGCAPKPIAFRALHTGGITAFQWELGDGDTDTLAAFSHTYEQDGLYSVSLTLTDTNGCSNTLTQEDLIDLRPPIPAFSADPLIICPGESISFLDESESDLPIVGWIWDFGDGDTLSEQHPQHEYLLSGWYDVQLTVIDEEGCVDSLRQPQLIEVLADTAPAPLEMQWVTVVDGQAIDLTFRPYPGSDFGWYEIFRSEDGGPFEWIARLEDQNSDSYTDRGLATEAHRYCYRVVVTNHCGTAHLLEESDTHCSVNLEQTAGEEAVYLRWNAYQGWESVDRYMLYRVADYGMNHQELLAILSGEEREYVDTNLFCYDAYSYRLLAVGGPGRSSWSDTTFSSPVHLLPQDPAHIQRVSVEGNQFLTVEWEVPEVDAAQELLVERDAGSGFVESYRSIFSNSTLKYQDVEVEVHQKRYTYRAFVQDSCGDLTPLGRSGTNVVLQAQRQNGIAQLQWNPYEGWEQGVAAYSIEVYNETTESFTLVAEIPGDENQYVDEATELRQGSLCYRITAWESGGNETFSYSNEACVMLDPVIYGANAFSPNGDGVNDAFVMAGNFLTSFEMRIYNRWGKLVFETRSPDQAWQGLMPDGDPAPEGVYMFVATGVGYQEQNIRKVGSITLVR